jgi:hypothetical protein
MIATRALPGCAGAVELTGACAADPDKCDKAFVRRGRTKLSRRVRARRGPMTNSAAIQESKQPPDVVALIG